MDAIALHQFRVCGNAVENEGGQQAACLFGYGAGAICPYLAFETIRDMLANDKKKRYRDLEPGQAM